MSSAHRPSSTLPSAISRVSTSGEPSSGSRVWSPLAIATGVVGLASATVGLGWFAWKMHQKHHHHHHHDHRGHPMPWRMGYLIDNAIRRWWFQPEKLFRPFVMPSSIVIDIGCGMGVNSLALAELVGVRGRVYAVDLQKEMIETTVSRFNARFPEGNNLTPILCKPDNLMLPVEVKGEKQWCDVALFFWVAHEVKDLGLYLRQLHSVMKEGARLLIYEPTIQSKKGVLEEEKELITSPELLPADAQGRRKPGFRFARDVQAPLSRGCMFVKV